MRRTATPFGALVIAAFVLVFSLVVTISNVTRADDNQPSSQDGRLVTIHDRGQETIVLSQSKTIGDVIKEAGISIDSKDVVEPALDQEMTANDYQVNIYRARPVIIVDGALRTKIITPYQTEKQIAESAGIKLYDEDAVSLQRIDDIIAEGAGLKLVIDRAVPFTFTLYGKTATVRTRGKTIDQMLIEKGIKMSSDDRITPSKGVEITDGMSVRLWREGRQTISVDEAIEFEVEKIENADKPVGFKEIKTAGIKGSRSVTYEVIIQDGKEVSRKEIASLTIKQPKTQVEVIGVMGQYTTPSENENITWDFLRSKGYTREQTAGIMGNLMQEHHFRTDGDGLAQWIGSRKDELYARPYPTNIYTQLDFLLYELTVKYTGTNNRIKASNSLTEVTLIFQNEFERCGICMESQRIQYAQNIIASHR